MVASRLLFGIATSWMALSSGTDAASVQRVGFPALMDFDGLYARMTQLNDGSLLAAYASHDGADHVIKTVRSTDGAQSWQYEGEVYRNVEKSYDIDNQFPLQLPSGRIVLAYRHHDRVGDWPSGDWHYTYYRIVLVYSDDGGHLWTYLSIIDERAASGTNGVWEPFLRIAKDGKTLQCFYSSENSADDQDIWMKTSTDWGATWSASQVSIGGDRIARDGMVGIASVDSNSLIAVVESHENDPFYVDGLVSTDDGYTWGARRRVYTSPGTRESSAPQVVNVGGVLVASFMSDEDVCTPSTDGGQMKVVVSTDGGNTWGSKLTTGGVGSHWPGLWTVNSTHFLALYFRDDLGAVSQLYKVIN